MRFALAVFWLPLLVTWVVGGLLLRFFGSERLRAERWWLVWPVLAVYLAVIVYWVLLPVVLVVGAVLYAVRGRLPVSPGVGRGLGSPGRPATSWPTIERKGEAEGR